VLKIKFDMKKKQLMQNLCRLFPDFRMLSGNCATTMKPILKNRPVQTIPKDEYSY